MATGDILLVDDDPGTIRMMARVLGPSMQMRFATNGSEALRLVERSVPDLILLDAQMPGMNGLEVYARLKSDANLAEVPVIFVSGHISADFMAAGFEIGAADILAKPFSPQHALGRVRSQLVQKHAADGLRHTGPNDAVTGAASRGRFNKSLAREWLRGRLFGASVALLLLEIDHFEAFVERYGAVAGDICLQAVAQELAVLSGRRGADVVARFGRDEFAVLLPQTARDAAIDMSYQVLEGIQMLAIPHATPTADSQLSVSIGIAVSDALTEGWSSSPEHGALGRPGWRDLAADILVETALKARYAAKLAGRAQARLFDISLPDRVHRGHQARRGAAPRDPRA